jgi:hypothetical protein
MFRGVPPELHGVTDKLWDVGFPPNFSYPSFVKVLREEFPTRDIGVFSNWAPIVTTLLEQDISYSKFTAKKDYWITQHTLDYLKDHDPLLLFVQFDECDHAGHIFGYCTDQQNAQVLATDEMMRKICNKLDERNLLKDKLLLFVTDHGGIKQDYGPVLYDHGGDSDDEVRIFFGALGRSVAHGKLNSPFYFGDVAAIVLHALGVKAPSSWTAKVPEGLFVSDG